MNISILKDQIKTEIGVEHTKLEHLVNAVEGILDNVRWRGNIPKFQKVKNLLHREEINQDED